MTDASPKTDRHPILFFDGECALCSRTVRWLLKRDRRAILRFAPLGGKTHSALGGPGASEGGSTLILVRDGEVFLRSAGVVRMLWSIGGVWALLGGLLWLIPLPLRDAGYRFVAARRYRWFGRADACPMPSDDTRARILD
mgnify:FL=1